MPPCHNNCSQKRWTEEDASSSAQLKMYCIIGLGRRYKRPIKSADSFKSIKQLHDWLFCSVVLQSQRYSLSLQILLKGRYRCLLNLSTPPFSLQTRVTWSMTMCLQFMHTCLQFGQYCTVSIIQHHNSLWIVIFLQLYLYCFCPVLRHWNILCILWDFNLYTGLEDLPESRIVTNPIGNFAKGSAVCIQAQAG